jgi:hypothetical protein
LFGKQTSGASRLAFTGSSWTPRGGACGSLLPYGEEVASRAGSCHCNPMILRRDQRIAGRPAKDVRKFLREIVHLKVACGYVRDVLGCSMDEAQQLLNALQNEGYLVRAGQCQGQELYETTVKGNGLASAKLRPIARATAERTLEGFMQRVHAVNSDPEYLETITGVIVFGSFISPRQKLGDVGVGIQLTRKAVDDDLFLELANARRELAQQRGKQFRNVSAWATWPVQEIWVYLKSRARQLSIHDFRELRNIPPFTCKILLGDKRSLARSLPNARFVE